MKKLLYTIAISVSCGALWAQQDPLFTQYRSNMLTINPAYAGSREALTFNLLHRTQWVGIEGAPTTQSVAVHGPLISDRLGFGLSLIHDKVGPTRQTGIYGDISGRVKVSEKGYLAGGVKIGANFFNSNLTELILANGSDGNFAENVSKTMPNVGVGIYYYTDDFYVGASMPKIIKNELYDNGSVEGAVSEKRHLFLNSGMVFTLSPLVKFRPTVMARVVGGAPLSFDANATFIFDDRFWVGGYYRLQESLGVLIDYNFTPQLKVGYSYDYTLTELQNYNTGSHEIGLTYDFIFKEKRIQSPRYF